MGTSAYTIGIAGKVIWYKFSVSYRKVENSSMSWLVAPATWPSLPVSYKDVYIIKNEKNKLQPKLKK